MIVSPSFGDACAPEGHCTVSTLDATADELARMAAALRQAGETQWRKQVTQGIKHSAEATLPAIREGLRPHLPDRYADVLNADLRLTVSVKTGAGDPGVFIVGRPSGKQRKLRIINSGNLRHPVFGQHGVPRRQWRWRDQMEPSVHPGWFSDPCENSRPEVRKEIEAALEQVNAIIWAAVHG
jgi:hypothetical protein